MTSTGSISNLSKALLKAQRNIGSAVKGAKNPFFKSSYADLGSVMEACKEALNEQGISVLQPVGNDNGINHVETILLHESGEFISDRLSLPAAKNMQELGSAISYVSAPTPRAGGFKPKTVAAGNTVAEDDGFDD